jgi:hypothetical protein
LTEGGHPDRIRAKLDGQPVEATELLDTTSAFGHFTAMQVRVGKARALALFQRLASANREFLGAALERDHVRQLIRH